MNEQFSKLLLQAKETFDRVCTESPTPWETRRSDPVWWNGLVHEWAEATRTGDWALMAMDSAAFYQKYPHIKTYHRYNPCPARLGLPNVQEHEPTWSDRGKAYLGREDEFQ